MTIHKTHYLFTQIGGGGVKTLTTAALLLLLAMLVACSDDDDDETETTETNTTTTTTPTAAPAPAPVLSVEYEDDGFDDADALTTSSEMTISGLPTGWEPTNTKVVSYVLTNTTDETVVATAIQVDDQPVLDSNGEFDMRDARSNLAHNEKLHSLILEHDGELVGYTFDPAMAYYDVARFNRKFSVVTNSDYLAITSNDIVLVTSTETDAVHFYDLEGDDATMMVDDDADSMTALVSASNFGSMGSGTNQFNNLADIKVVDGKIYIADRVNSRIQIFNADFSFRTNITPPAGDVVFVFLSIYDGYVYTTSLHSDSSKTVLRTYALDDFEQGASIVPSGEEIISMAVDEGGVYHVVSRLDDQVEAWKGDPEAGFTARGTDHRHSLRVGSDSTGEASDPISLIVGPTTDRIYVSDFTRHQVVVLEYDGDAESAPYYTEVAVLGKEDRTSGTEDGEFSGPLGMLIHKGELYVIQSGNSRVQVFTVPE